MDCSSVKGKGFLQIEIPSSQSSFSQSAEFLAFGSEVIDNKVPVYCEDNWLVIQQRNSGFQTNFNRSWNEYSIGFGSLKSDFWLGLDTISKLTLHQPYELIIELVDWSGNYFYAHYENFQISDAQDFYRLSLSGFYNGNASQDYLEDVNYGEFRNSFVT